MKNAALLLILLLSLIFAPPSHAQMPTGLTAEEAQRVENLLASMTLEEKVGQLFMVSIYGRRLPEAGELLITQYHPGAVALFNYNTEWETGGSVAFLINQMQTAATSSGAEIPLIIAADQEGGRVRRIVNEVTQFPDPLWLGAITDMDVIREVGRVTGAELRAIGVNMNLAPVADLYTREDMFDKNRVLHRRTFGDDPNRVGEQAAAYAQGLGAAEVIGVLKHYPGHGGAADSHKELPHIEMDAATALNGPLRAFEVAVREGVPAIMVGHLNYTALEPVPNLPASLSPTMIGILRHDFGFDGLVMTDAMDMAAIAGNFEIPQAALMAIQAGVDMVVMGPNISWATQQNSIQRVMDAASSGELSQTRLDESVRRILSLKAQYELLDWQPLDPDQVTAQYDPEPAQAALLESYMAAATVVRDERRLLPLDPQEKIAVVYPAIYETIYFTCLELAREIEYYGYVFYPEIKDFNSVSRLGIEYDKIVIFVEDATKHLIQSDLVKVLPPEKTIVVALSSPYDLELFPDVSTFMALYTSLDASQAAACKVLFGDHPARGRLPIAVGNYPSGSGIDIDGWTTGG